MLRFWSVVPIVCASINEERDTDKHTEGMKENSTRFAQLVKVE